jgi:hypothetical protein
MADVVEFKHEIPLPVGSMAGLCGRRPGGWQARPLNFASPIIRLFAWHGRAAETILDGKPATPFLKAGDRVRIWMEDESGHSIFGAIEQEVIAA